MRYLRQCEGRRPDLTHLSVQLLPYPWFERQKEDKALYPKVVFPPLFPGVSTHKRDPGNARLIEEFLVANWRHFGGQQGGGRDGGGKKGKKGGSGIFVDMQSVDDPQIGSRGAWRSAFDLIPHGPLYRVQPRAPSERCRAWWVGRPFA